MNCVECFFFMLPLIVKRVLMCRSSFLSGTQAIHLFDRKCIFRFKLSFEVVFRKKRFLNITRISLKSEKLNFTVCRSSYSFSVGRPPSPQGVRTT